MVSKRRVAASLSGAAAWIKPALHLISIPGYIDDGQAWPVIWRSLGVTMTALDWGLIIVGVPCFLYGFQVQTWPRRLQSSIRRYQPTEVARVRAPPKPTEPEMTDGDDRVEPPAEKQIRASTTTSAPPEASSSPAQDDTKAWITKAEALQMIRSSSLVQLRLPRETTFVQDLWRMTNFAPSPTGRRCRADEISRHLLRKFESQCRGGVRNGTYYSESLREWIDQEAYEENPPTR